MLKIKRKIRWIKATIFSVCILIVSCNFSEENKKTETPSISDTYKKGVFYQDLSKKNIPIDSINRLAVNEWSRDNYQKAFDLITIAYKKAKEDNNDEELAKVLNTLGLIHWRLGNNEDAMNCYVESGKLSRQLKLYKLLGLTHTNRGLILKEEKKYEDAFKNNNTAITLFKKHKFFKELGIALNNQGQIFKNQKKNDSARVYYEQALHYYQKVDYKDGMAATYYNLSEINTRQNYLEAALDAAQKSLSLSLEINRDLRIRESNHRIFEVYEHFNQPDSALKYFKIYNQLNTKILEASQSKQLAKYQAEMGAEVKNLQIQNLKKEKKLADNRLWFIGIGIGTILLLIAFFVYRYLSKIQFKKSQLEMELDSSKKVLSVKEQELKEYIIDLSKKNSTISKLTEKLINEVNIKEKSTKVEKLLEQKILTEEDWEIFKSKFKSIYPGFFTKIKTFRTNLTEAEVRFLVLFHLDISSKEMAKTLGISPQSVRVCKMRLKKKLQQEGFEDVEAIIPLLIN